MGDEELKKSIDLVLKLEGPTIDEGIDLFKLAPGLLALGISMKEATKLIDPSVKDVSIDIRPFSKGSFNIQVSIFKNLLQIAKDFLFSSKYQELKNVLIWLGIAAGVSGYSLKDLIIFLRGKKPKNVEQLPSGEVKITNYQGVSTIVNGNVYNLFTNQNVTKPLLKGFTDLLGEEGVEEMQSYIKDEEEFSQTITKTDYEHLKTFYENITKGEEDVNESIRVAYLKFKRGSFDGEGNNWSFKIGDNIIVATIKDEKFLEKIKRGEIRPSHIDIFKVKLLERQKRVGFDIKTTYEILEVIEYKKVEPLPELFEQKDKNKK